MIRAFSFPAVSPERSRRLRGWLEGTLAGLCELHLLRERQERRVKQALRLAASESPARQAAAGEAGGGGDEPAPEDQQLVSEGAAADEDDGRVWTTPARRLSPESGCWTWSSVSPRLARRVWRRCSGADAVSGAFGAGERAREGGSESPLPSLQEAGRQAGSGGGCEGLTWGGGLVRPLPRQRGGRLWLVLGTLPPRAQHAVWLGGAGEEAPRPGRADAPVRRGREKERLPRSPPPRFLATTGRAAAAAAGVFVGRPSERLWTRRRGGGRRIRVSALLFTGAALDGAGRRF